MAMQKRPEQPINAIKESSIGAPIPENVPGSVEVFTNPVATHNLLSLLPESQFKKSLAANLAKLVLALKDHFPLLFAPNVTFLGEHKHIFAHDETIVLGSSGPSGIVPTEFPEPAKVLAIKPIVEKYAEMKAKVREQIVIAHAALMQTSNEYADELIARHPQHLTAEHKPHIASVLANAVYDYIPTPDKPKLRPPEKVEHVADALNAKLDPKVITPVHGKMLFLAHDLQMQNYHRQLHELCNLMLFHNAILKAFDQSMPTLAEIVEGPNYKSPSPFNTNFVPPISTKN